MAYMSVHRELLAVINICANPNLNVDLLKIEQVVIFLRIKGRPCDKNLSKTPKDDSTFCIMKSDVTDNYFYHDDIFNLLVKWHES